MYKAFLMSPYLPVSTPPGFPFGLSSSMDTLDTLLGNYSEPDECTYIVHFPGLGCNPAASFHRTLLPPPFESIAPESMSTQGLIEKTMPLPRMLQTLSRVIPTPRFVLPSWKQDRQFSITHVPLAVLDLGAEHYPTHALFVFSPIDPSRMSMYLVHSIVLEMYCPALHASLPPSPTSSIAYTPTIRPRIITIPVHPVCIAYPEAFGILLPYFYTRDPEFLVCQCLPLFKWTSLDPFDELQNKFFRVSLGYFLAQMVPYQTLIEHTVKTVMLAKSAWQLTTLNAEFWKVLENCYEILLNAIAYTTTGRSLKRILND
ncbi:hypothetical protein J3R30DRAFT_863122 [Lentinula aciculospora]|uniref:Uncharacterized protein n=1 Tax=Lentinula aciculospora TaxID=153920 RepID=A0A9W9AQ41_9AGAR|nr:hypothetical protein J3R30DRAFT_863122 [Lentinula aciculospora]